MTSEPDGPSGPADPPASVVERMARYWALMASALADDDQTGADATAELRAAHEEIRTSREGGEASAWDAAVAGTLGSHLLRCSLRVPAEDHDTVLAQAQGA